MDELLFENAQKTFLSHFSPETSFERAIFFSWGCSIGDCGFCYMSTQPLNKRVQETRRSFASIIAECIIARELGWDIGFVTGGIGVLKPEELETLLRYITEVIGEKVWLSIGPVRKNILQRCAPYIKGIVGSTETINKTLHKKVCPSKPLEPYEQMFLDSEELGLKKAMTFIVGLGETHDDLTELIEFISKYKIDKIHIYSLIPQEGTMYEHIAIPSKEEHAWWIAQVRCAFPSINIQCGIWDDRVDRVSFLLNAGANSISKFQAIKFFGKPEAYSIERETEKAGRQFRGTLTVFPKKEFDTIVNAFSFSEDMKKQVLEKLEQYLHSMRKTMVVKN